MELVLYLPVPPDPGGRRLRAGQAVAGNQVDDLDGFLAVPGDGAAQLGDLGGAGELDPRGGEDGLDRAAGAVPVVLPRCRRSASPRPLDSSMVTKPNGPRCSSGESLRMVTGAIRCSITGR